MLYILFKDTLLSESGVAGILTSNNFKRAMNSWPAYSCDEDHAITLFPSTQLVQTLLLGFFNDSPRSNPFDFPLGTQPVRKDPTDRIEPRASFPKTDAQLDSDVILECAGPTRPPNFNPGNSADTGGKPKIAAIASAEVPPVSPTCTFHSQV
ncbi:hypothetical protein MVEN_02173400 [Mycena venus]|uniref:Uncharacterized protein n=1 Tax=Mycena venus TaxID=2733690 RepID=A0A8H7CI47_9AGAR|nr:hypothetical protein MVEN_02173400 [Mycena venus]